MSVDQLRSQNTQNARSVGVNAFMRFLEKESVSVDYVYESLARDPSDRCFATTMDKFAMHLALAEGARGRVLAANTVMSYFRNVKNWLLDSFPHCKAVIEHRVLEMGRILEKHCTQRETEGPTRQANACTKNDLARMIQYLYANATNSSDYQDAALINLMWFVFGRASDLSIIHNYSPQFKSLIHTISITPPHSPYISSAMEKRQLKQWSIKEKLEKLALWRANPSWLPSEAAKNLKVAKGTLCGWREQFPAAQPPSADTLDRTRKAGAGRKHKLEPYELEVLAYYDERVADGELMSAAELLKHCQQIPQFAQRNDKTQKTWVYRFLKRYKTADQGRAVAPNGAETEPRASSELARVAEGEPNVPVEIPCVANIASEPLSVDTNATGHASESSDENGGGSSSASGDPSACEESEYSDGDEGGDGSSDSESDYVEVVRPHAPAPARGTPSVRSLRSQGTTPTRAMLTYAYKNAHQANTDDLTGYVLEDDINSLKPEQTLTSGIVDRRLHDC